MKTTQSILDQILVDVRQELAEAQRQRPMAELKSRLKDAPALRSMSDSLRQGFGLIAEVKERSPSHGPMRRANVDAAPAAYEGSRLVRGISVLTNTSHFGMSMDRLRSIKIATTKPILRKDFIFDPYQVYEARAFGADAILLMANLLESEEMRVLHATALELGMEALFECHNREQIEQVPGNAVIFGINSRTFDARKNMLGVGRYAISAMLGRLGTGKDLTVDESRFELGQFLPAHAIKVAESGVHPHTIAPLRDVQGYHAALVGTSLLAAPDGIQQELQRFEDALKRTASPSSSAPTHAPVNQS